MRPQKTRIIRGRPTWRRYRPEGSADAPEMDLSLDMFEAMRLVDAEGQNQDEAARGMGVSTATLCRLLGEARRRVATALRDGWTLHCDGGNVIMQSQAGYGRHGGPGPHCREDTPDDGRQGRGRGHGRGPGGMGRAQERDDSME